MATNGGAPSMAHSQSSHTIADDASEASAEGNEDDAGLARQQYSGPGAGQPVDGDNPWRDEIVRTIFGDVGVIRRDFSCAPRRRRAI